MTNPNPSPNPSPIPSPNPDPNPIPTPTPTPTPNSDPNQELCAKHGGEGSVAFVEHYPGNASGYVRFAAAAGATLALAALATSAEEVCGATLTLTIAPNPKP